MRRLLAAILLVAGATSVDATAVTATMAHKAPPLVVLVVAGQSNALGEQSYVVDPKTHWNAFAKGNNSPADKQVLLTWEESGVQGGSLPPVPLDTPQRVAGAPSPIFGPELGLARFLYGAGHRNLLIVKVAFSGTSLATDWTTKSPDYRALVARVQATMAWARYNRWAPVIGGFYWMQGESDSLNPTMAAAYRANLDQFLVAVRSSLRLSGKTPVVVGQTDLTDYIGWEQSHHRCGTPTCAAQRRWNAEVMHAQASVVGAHTFLAPTSRFPRYLNFIHLSDHGELSLGEVFGQQSLPTLAGT